MERNGTIINWFNR